MDRGGTSDANTGGISDAKAGGTSDAPTVIVSGCPSLSPTKHDANLLVLDRCIAFLAGG